MRPSGNPPMPALSAREREVATHVAADKSNRLNVHSRVELVAAMLQAPSRVAAA
jgi:hypothetical protein